MKLNEAKTKGTKPSVNDSGTIPLSLIFPSLEIMEKRCTGKGKRESPKSDFQLTSQKTGSKPTG